MLHELSTLIGTIYDCVLAPSRWSATLGEIGALFGCEKAILSLNDLQHGRMLIAESVGWEPRWLEERARHAPEINATLSEWLARGHAQDVPFVGSREIAAERAEVSAYVQHCLRPLRIGDVAHYFLIRTATHFSELVLARPEQKGAFTDEEIELGDLLLPHLRRAVTISRVLDVQAFGRRLLAETLDALRCGVVLVDEDGAIVHANRAAQRLLGDGGPLVDHGGCLRARLSSAHRELRRAIALGVRDETGIGKAGIAIRLSPAGRAPLFAHVLPLNGGDLRIQWQAAAAVFVGVAADDGERVEALACAFGLTPAEARVVSGLTAGSTLTDVAKQLGVARATAKTHLDNVFLKTGTGRQADVIRLVARSFPPILPRA